MIVHQYLLIKSHLYNRLENLPGPKSNFVDFCGLLVNRCTSWVIRKSLEVFIFKGSEQLIPENR